MFGGYIIVMRQMVFSHGSYKTGVRISASQTILHVIEYADPSKENCLGPPAGEAAVGKSEMNLFPDKVWNNRLRAGLPQPWGITAVLNIAHPNFPCSLALINSLLAAHLHARASSPTCYPMRCCCVYSYGTVPRARSASLS